jgi:hypothetical protein
LVGWAHIFNESEMARSSECKEQYAQKTLDTADIVRDAIYANKNVERAGVPSLQPIQFVVRLSGIACPRLFPLQ